MRWTPLYVNKHKNTNNTNKTCALLRKTGGKDEPNIVKFCTSFFVLLNFFFWPLCGLSFFDLRLLITSLVSSNCSSINYTLVYASGYLGYILIILWSIQMVILVIYKLYSGLYKWLSWLYIDHTVVYTNGYLGYI